jgi:hypothetical protein
MFELMTRITYVPNHGVCVLSTTDYLSNYFRSVLNFTGYSWYAAVKK